jgi:hypothetical protein
MDQEGLEPKKIEEILNDDANQLKQSSQSNENMNVVETSKTNNSNVIIDVNGQSHVLKEMISQFSVLEDLFKTLNSRLTTNFNISPSTSIESLKDDITSLSGFYSLLQVFCHLLFVLFDLFSFSNQMLFIQCQFKFLKT